MRALLAPAAFALAVALSLAGCADATMPPASDAGGRDLYGWNPCPYWCTCDTWGTAVCADGSGPDSGRNDGGAR